VPEVVNQDGIIGRLWVSPPAIRFRPGKEFGGRFLLINTGSEDVRVETVTVTGDPDFHSLDFIGSIVLPTTLTGSDACGGASVIDGTLAYTPASGDDAKGILRVYTDDPTSPSFNVPVYLDANCSYPHGAVSPGDHFPVHEPSVMIKPNPIRFGATTTTVEVCFLLLDLGFAQAWLKEVWIDGDSFSLTSPPYRHEHSSEYRASVELNPDAPELKDGYLVVEFEDPWETPHIIRVPILYR
jgi:hypothetical protein